MDKSEKRFESIDLIPGEATFRAYGKSLSELFSNAALALFSVMVDLSTVQPQEERAVDLKGEHTDRLLIDFLSELVYLKDRDSMLFAEFTVDVSKNSTYRLRAKLRGEPISQDKHRLGVDVKGVTMHRYKFEQTYDGFSAQIVLDV